MDEEVSGTGRIPLVCVHGWGCEKGQFDGLARELADEFRIYRFDLPGHGGTPLGDFAPGFDAYTAAMAEFVSSHGLESPVLLGHSMGGVLSLMAAPLIRPQAIINLDGSMPAASHTLAGQAVLRGWLETPDFRTRLAGALREGFFLPSEQGTKCEEIIRTMCAAPEAVLRFLPEHVGDLEPDRILQAVNAPVMFVGAERPRFDPDRAAALLPQGRFERIPGAGHFLHIYALPRVVELIRDFLRFPL